MAGFKNRLHEQLARRTAREAFRGAGGGTPVAAACEPCEAQFSSVREDDLRDQLEAHYKTAEHRMATQLPVHKQRGDN